MAVGLRRQETVRERLRREHRHQPQRHGAQHQMAGVPQVNAQSGFRGQFPAVPRYGLLWKNRF